MADSTNDSIRPSQREPKEIDASIHPYCWLLSIPAHCGLCPYETIIRLENDQIVRSDFGVCGKSISYRPYSSVGAVQESKCLCLSCIDSNLGTIISGWGCDEEWSKATANEIKTRADAFSDWNHIQMTEEIAVRSQVVFDKMETIERLLENASTPQSMTISER